MSNYQTGVLENSAKMVLLFHLIDESVGRRDKILVFRYDFSIASIKAAICKLLIKRNKYYVDVALTSFDLKHFDIKRMFSNLQQRW